MKAVRLWVILRMIRKDVDEEMHKVAIDGQKLLDVLGLDETCTKEDVAKALERICGNSEEKFLQLLSSCRHEQTFAKTRKHTIKELQRRIKYSQNYMEKKALQRMLDDLYRV